MDLAIEILNKFIENNYEAYIVGGYVRNYLLNINSNDIDICTNAKPKEIKKIFNNIKLPKEKYNSIILYYKNNKFEITTFRKELEYKNRKPIKIEYVNTLIEDLKRRDFTINTLCINNKREVIDLLNAKKDLDEKIIKTVKPAKESFAEDNLRMLRAIRIATQLKFNLSKDIINEIEKDSIKKISKFRKKQELDKIFESKNLKIGVKLLKSFDLLEVLDIKNIDEIKLIDSKIGIWSQLKTEYEFTKKDLREINIIKALLKKKINDYDIYKYSYNLCNIASKIKDKSLKNNLIINSRKDIDIVYEDIKDITNNINEAYEYIEKLIILKKIENKKEVLIKYLKEKYN